MFRNKRRIILIFMIIFISILGYVLYTLTATDEVDVYRKTENIKEADGLPKKFNLADIIDIKVEDQGNLGLCWAFAAIKSLETNVLLKTR